MSAFGPTGVSDNPPTASAQDRVGWLDVPLYPVRLAQEGWRRIPGNLRSTIRVIVWLVLLAGSIRAVFYCVGVFRSVMDWKTGAQWEAFLQQFVTSPAAAGTAALLAAIIAAWSFTKGLNHTKAEARAKAWREQFEWVTDRIVPKDPKQERLHKGLALSLLAALEATAEGKFQREAVSGIRHTYIRGTAVDHADIPLGELRAQLREVKTFFESSWMSENKELTSHFRSYVYLLETLVALRTAWDATDVKIVPPAKQSGLLQGRRKTLALVRTGRSWVLIDTRTVAFQMMEGNAERLIRLMYKLEASSIIVLVLSPMKDGPLNSTTGNGTVRYIHWDPKEGAAELRKRIEVPMAPGSSISPAAGEEPSLKGRISRSTESTIPGSISRRRGATSWRRGWGRRKRGGNEHPVPHK